MNSILDILLLRRPRLEYVSPPVCDFIFSGSSFPIIILNPLPHHFGPTGLVAGGTGNFFLSWDIYPGALCYTIYKALDPADPFGPYRIIAECINGSTPGCPSCPPTVNLTPFGPGCYRVSAITLDGESDLSDPNCDVGHTAPPPPTGCDQTGPAVPDTLATATNISLGVFQLPLTPGSIPIAANATGGWDGFYEVRYLAGAVFNSSSIGYCPLSWDVYPTLNYKIDFQGTFGPETADVGPFSDVCSPSQADAEQFVFNAYGANPAVTAIIHQVTTGPISWNPSRPNTTTNPDLVDGDPGVTFEIVQQYQLVPQATVYKIATLLDFGSAFICENDCTRVKVHPNYPAVTQWNGVFGDQGAENYIPSEYYNESFFNAADNIALGNRLMELIFVKGPITGTSIINDLTFFEIDATGLVIPDKQYWYLFMRGPKPTPTSYAGSAIWVGVKEYGNTPVGNYRKIFGCCQSAPECVTVEVA